MELFFDEHMAMCNIISCFQIGTDISSHANQTSITYKIVPHEDQDIETLINVLSTAIVTIYGHCYNILTLREDNKICLTLTEKKLLA